MITQKRLKELLDYDENTGKLTYKVARTYKTPIGKEVGWVNSAGYRYCEIEGKMYSYHRLVWLYYYGEWPINQIDHIDCNPANNKITNLREATPVEDSMNKRSPRKDNKSGFLGVNYNKDRNRFEAYICVYGKRIGLGRFDTPEEAHQAYLEAKRMYHPTCTI